MPHPADALRTAVRSQLLAQQSVAEVLSGIYETAPAQAPYPYMTFGDERISDWSAQSFTGTQHQLFLNTWSSADSFGELYELHALMRHHLSTDTLALEGHKLVVFFLEEERFLTDRRRKSRLGVLRYRALTHPQGITAAA